MKTFTFKFDDNPSKSAFARIKKAIETGVPDIRGNVMVFDCIDSLLKVMPKTRFDAFLAIVKHSPHSVYQLAKLMNKDLANITRDVRSLEALGLVKLKRVSDGERDRTQPIALYDRVEIHFEPQKNVANE